MHCFKLPIYELLLFVNVTIVTELSALVMNTVCFGTCTAQHLRGGRHVITPVKQRPFMIM